MKAKYTINKSSPNANFVVYSIGKKRVINIYEIQPAKKPMNSVLLFIFTPPHLYNFFIPYKNHVNNLHDVTGKNNDISGRKNT